eukprot:TRINITY_DN3576_c0_g1_i1.p1 TRINITY_DN3576_c0_g1~~TRINITY_DN3576_c0_g1_i1.p1  ORF type:complete len:263 (-),score=37.36 TRINITY_DN3576_c0_g1_i1:35-823(-)
MYSPNKNKLIKNLKLENEELLGDIEFIEVKDNLNIVSDLVHMEDRILVKAYKFGVVYCKDGQTDERDMFSNNDPSEGFIRFMDMLGEKITLKGYEGYKGGLDTTDNTTGEYSYITTFKNFEIMFHISVYLPFNPNNRQQIHRKRHIGNDVIVIVYQDGPNGGFLPSTISSKFNHVYAVVQPVQDVNKDSYQFGIVAKNGVRCHGPVLPYAPVIFPHGDEFREILLTKLINSERAAYFAPGFAQTRTRRMWLKEIVERYSSPA